MKRFLRKRLIKRLERPPDEERSGRTGLLLGVGAALLTVLGIRRRARRRGKAEARIPTDVERRAAFRIGLLLVLAFAAGVGLVMLFALGGQPQLEGVLLGLALGGMGFALILWGKYLFPHEIVTEEREPHPSTDQDRRSTEEEIAEAEGDVTRRTFLVRLGLAAAGAFGLAMVFPIASLGPNPKEALLHTSWRRGSRVVDENGVPVSAADLEEGGVVTVFPEHAIRAEDSQAIVVKVAPDELHIPGRNSWAPDGNVCYSKLCTHAGCPVGLYLKDFHQLQCPCHQSAFDVLDGGNVVFGPAPRALPQLQLYVDAEGYLRAAGDFPEPVGPSFWNRP